MPISETAEGLALRLLASYPGVPASKMAVVAIAESLDRMGLDIAEDVVERARSEIMRVPSVAQLYEVAREIRADQEPKDRYAIAPGDLLAAMPPEVAEKVAALRDGNASANDYCRECQVRHMTRTHEEHIARAQAARKMYLNQRTHA